MKIFYLLFLLLSLPALSCPGARNRINKFFESRTQAFNNAKRDARIPKGQTPLKVEHVPMQDINGRPIFDSNHQIIVTREYHFKNTEGREIVIQEHTAAHEGASREAGGMPHLNVRPIEDLRHGKVPGTAAHYNIGL